MQTIGEMKSVPKPPQKSFTTHLHTFALSLGCYFVFMCCTDFRRRPTIAMRLMVQLTLKTTLLRPRSVDLNWVYAGPVKSRMKSTSPSHFSLNNMCIRRPNSFQVGDFYFKMIQVTLVVYYQLLKAIRRT